MSTEKKQTNEDVRNFRIEDFTWFNEAPRGTPGSKKCSREEVIYAAHLTNGNKRMA